MAMACESRGVAPVFRVGGVISSEILRALEIGVHCLHVPNVSTAKEASDVVAFSKYPPVGNRGLSPFTRATGYSHQRADGRSIVNRDTAMLAIHIEGREAIDQIDDILMIPEIDIIFIGLFDLSKSLGLPGQVEDGRIKDVAAELANRTRTAGKCPGTIVVNEKQLAWSLEVGMRYITYSADCDVLLRSYRGVEAQFRNLQLAFRG